MRHRAPHDRRRRLASGIVAAATRRRRGSLGAEQSAPRPAFAAPRNLERNTEAPGLASDACCRDSSASGSGSGGRGRRQRDRWSDGSEPWFRRRRAIYAYASRRVGRGTADEIAAETFLVAWRKFDVLPAARCRGSMAWRATWWRATMSASGRRRQTTAALERERPRSTDSGEDRDGTRLWDAWGQLNAGDREVLALVAWRTVGR